MNRAPKHIEVYIRFLSADKNLETYRMIILDKSSRDENVGEIVRFCPAFVWRNRRVVSYRRI
jgi:hypothetical protein